MPDYIPEPVSFIVVRFDRRSTEGIYQFTGIPVELSDQYTKQ